MNLRTVQAARTVLTKLYTHYRSEGTHVELVQQLDRTLDLLLEVQSEFEEESLAACWHCKELFPQEQLSAVNMLCPECDKEDPIDPEACPGCGSTPGQGITALCSHPEGCGHWRQYAHTDDPDQM